MKNEFGIDVQSTIEPKKRMNFEDWARKFNVGILYQRRDADCLIKMSDYDFTKLNNPKKKNFVDKFKLFKFA